METALRTLTDAPSVVVDGREHRLGPRNLAILVRIRYADHAVPRRELGDWFWPSRQFRPSLSTALRELRKVLSERVVPSNDDPITLREELPADTDLVERAAANPTDDAVRSALQVYSAPFLWGIEHKLFGTRELIPWILAERERFRAAMVGAVETCCRAALARGSWPEVQELVSLAEERGLSSDQIEEWKRTAAERAIVPAPQVAALPHGRRRWGRTGGIVAAAGLLAAAIVLAGRTGREPWSRFLPGGCGRGAAAHLVRKEYKPENNIPIAPGRTYSPLWVLRNEGLCSWDAGYRLRRVATLGPHSLNPVTSVIPLPRDVPPGDTVTLTHKVTAPPTPADYGEDWVLEDADGRPVPVDGRNVLWERFQVLPQPVPPCTGPDIRAAFLAASHPDSAVVWPEEAFVTTWTIANRGKCVWQPGQVSIRLIGAAGRRMSNPGVAEIRTMEPIRPADAYTFEVPERAPASGASVERWTVRTVDGRAAEELVLRASARNASSREANAGGVRECKVGEEVIGWLRSERVQDSTVVTAGDTVRKTWTLRNESECTWPARSLTLRWQYATAPRDNAVTSLSLDRAVPPGATYTFSTPLVAPAGQRLYEERWELVNRKDTRLRVGQVLNLTALIKIRPRPGVTDRE